MIIDTIRGAEIRKPRLRDLLLRRKYDGNTKNMVLAAYVDIAWRNTTKRSGNSTSPG